MPFLTGPGRQNDGLEIETSEIPKCDFSEAYGYVIVYVR
ncbi:hypothetical protein J2S43_004203 [Catenuloplanes nepalensis]|uniref:Uncharacterized protein n=1 Tax=Catenuloplanes nepalensis TaxID=587533 RepID=A0ABT9MWQ6_9ACTN|nr:hypothetical protein [Catenuloplanes nepalensis]